MPAVTVKANFQGFEEFNTLVNEIREDFGPKDSKKILEDGAKLALVPTLLAAQNLAPKDTGALAASLRIEARRPNARDKRSRYVSPTDVVIGTVTTAPGNVLAKRRFFNLHNKNSKIQQIGIESDARANVMEYGSAHIPGGRPYMRPSLLMTQQAVTDGLLNAFKTALAKYRSKHS